MVFLQRARGLWGSVPLAFRDLPLQGRALRVDLCLLRLRRIRALGLWLGLALCLLSARRRPCLRGLLAFRFLRPLRARVLRRVFVVAFFGLGEFYEPPGGQYHSCVQEWLGSGFAQGLLTSPSACCSSLSASSSSESSSSLAQPAGTGFVPFPSSLFRPSLLPSLALATGASSLGEHPCTCLGHGRYLLRGQRHDVLPPIDPPLAPWRSIVQSFSDPFTLCVGGGCRIRCSLSRSAMRPFSSVSSS